MLNITNNITVRNSVIIGCGGLGGNVVGHLKNIVKDYFDLRTFNGVRFLVIDTASPDSSVCPHVKSIGKDIYRVKVESRNLKNILKTPQNYSRIYESLPEINELEIDDNIKQIPSLSQGCGTIRYLGRLSIRSGDNAKNIYNLLNSLSESREIQKTKDGKQVEFDREAPLVFIVSSLFGGTGSGIFWDVAAIAKKAIPDSINIGLFFLPSFHESRESIDRIKAGAYASLKELEYYIRGNPIEWHYEIPEARIIQVSNQEFSDFIFQSIFLIDRPKGYEGKIGRCEIAEPIAEFLFYLTFSEIGKDFLNREADLHGGTIYLKDFPELHESERRKGVIREQRKAFFSSFSIKTLEIPLEDLLNYSKTRFSYEVGKKIMYADLPGEINEDALVNGRAGEQGLKESLHITESDFENFFKKDAGVLRFPPKKENPLMNLAAQLDNIPNIVKDWEKSFKETLDKKRKFYISERLAMGEFLKAIREIINRYNINLGRNVCNKLYRELEIIKNKKESISTDLQEKYNATALNNFIESQKDSLIELKGEYQRRIRGLSDRVVMTITRRYPISDEMKIIIESMIDEVNSFLENYQIILRNRYIILLIESMEQELLRIKENEIPLIQNNLYTIYDHLKGKMDRELLNIRKSSLTTETIEIDNLEGKFFEKIIQFFGRKDKPENIANKIKEEKMDITGDEKGVAFFIDEIENITEKIFEKYNDEINNRIMKIDFDNEFINYHPGRSPDDVEQITNQISNISPYLNFDKPPTTEKHYLFSGSMIKDQSPKNWKEALKNNFPDIQITEGRYPDKVTLINFYLGIPLVSIPDLKDWYNEYIKKIEKKFPVHVMKSCVYMPECWFDPNYKPDEFIDQLFECLVELDILEDNGSNKFRYSLRKRTEYSDLFIESRTEEKKYLSEEDFKKQLKVNYILHHDLKENLIRRIIEKRETGEIVIDDYIKDLKQKGNDWIDFANMLSEEIDERLRYY